MLGTTLHDVGESGWYFVASPCVRYTVNVDGSLSNPYDISWQVVWMYDVDADYL